RARRLLVSAMYLSLPLALTACPTPGVVRREAGPAVAQGSAAVEARYRAAVEASPADALAQYNLATALSQLGRLEEAVVHYEKAAKLRPREPAYQIGLASAYHRSGRVGAAAEVYGQVLARFPTWPDIGRRVVEVAFDRSALDPALAELEAMTQATQYS